MDGNRDLDHEHHDDLPLGDDFHFGDNEEVAELSKKGYQALKDNRIDEAEIAFTDLLQLAPENNYALVGLGDVCRKKRAYRRAITYYEECLNLYHGNNYALFGLADCYKALGQFNKALEIWEEYLDQDDQNITVLTRVADAYRKVRNFHKSKETYLKVLDMEADNPYALIGLGHLHYDFKEFKDALHFWERMVEVNRENVDIRVLTSIGNCHRKLKTYEDGIYFFNRALERQPDNFYALFGMADCYRGIGNSRKSLEFWNRILDKDPENKVILTRAGDAYRQLADFDQAEISYKKALNIEFDLYAAIGMAIVYRNKKQYSDAEQTIKTLLENDASNPRLYVELAETYLEAGKREEALEVLVQFQRRGLRSHQISDLMNRVKDLL